jgi:hypothetical protein
VSRPIIPLLLRNAAAAILDTQSVTTGTVGSSPNRVRGKSTPLGIGSITDGTSNIYGGAVIIEAYWAENGAVGTDYVNLTITGIVANSGWTHMLIDGSYFTRTGAGYSNPGGNSSWQWPNLGYLAAGNPFGAASSVHTIEFI